VQYTGDPGAHSALPQSVDSEVLGLGTGFSRRKVKKRRAGRKAGRKPSATRLAPAKFKADRRLPTKRPSYERHRHRDPLKNVGREIGHNYG